MTLAPHAFLIVSPQKIRFEHRHDKSRENVPLKNKKFATFFQFITLDNIAIHFTIL
jgi:hypothetical protein